jgi:hypothetical protein
MHSWSSFGCYPGLTAEINEPVPMKRLFDLRDRQE